MTVGIMQPYFLPYIGYWQLMNAVDVYVIFDNVNFIKGGWINRNRILCNDKIKYINLPMHGMSQNKHINEVLVSRDRNEINKTMNRIKEAYRKAPYFDDTYKIICDIFDSHASTASDFISDSFNIICSYLEIRTKRILSSEVEKEYGFRGQERILSICRELGANMYVNAIGGTKLYSEELFESYGIKLRFLETEYIEYRQFNEEFVPNLSIVDVMMFNDRDIIREMLNRYKLIDPHEARA